MQIYKNIKNVKSSGTASKNVVIFSGKKLKLFSCVFVCVLSFAIMGFSLSDFSLSAEIRQITSYWSPNLEGLGKLKFVSNDETIEEAMASIYELALPFDNTYFSEVSAGEFEANGLGSVVVKCCLPGKVTKVETENNLRTVYISHKRGLVSVYSNLDNVGVKEGDKVEKNHAIGVSLQSKIHFKVLFKNKLLAGLTVKNGELTFM